MYIIYAYIYAYIHKVDAQARQPRPARRLGAPPSGPPRSYICVYIYIDRYYSLSSLSLSIYIYMYRCMFIKVYINTI